MVAFRSRDDCCYLFQAHTRTIPSNHHNDSYSTAFTAPACTLDTICRGASWTSTGFIQLLLHVNGMPIITLSTPSSSEHRNHISFKIVTFPRIIIFYFVFLNLFIRINIETIANNYCLKEMCLTDLFVSIVIVYFQKICRCAKIFFCNKIS